MSEVVEIGVLGCANIAERYILNSINSLDHLFHLNGIASRSIDKANLFAEKFSTKAFFSYDDLINNSEIDAIYIPLPNSMHFEWIKKALKLGKHVLVEKSMATEYKQVIELNSIAETNNLVLLENFQFRFHSQLEYIKNIINEQIIGELRIIRSSFGFPPFKDKNNIRYQKYLGGGALMDAGAYPIKISQALLGNELYISDAKLYIDPDLQVDLLGSGVLSMNKGKIVSQFAFGFDNFYQCNLELWGSKGRLYTNRIFTSPPGFCPIIELETEKGKEIITLDEDDHFKNMLQYFFKMIIKGKNKQEYADNINQSRLLSEFKDKSNEK